MPASKPRTGPVQHALFHTSVRAERRLKLLLQKFLRSVHNHHAKYQYEHRRQRLIAIRSDLALLREEERIAHEELIDTQIHLKSLQ